MKISLFSRQLFPQKSSEEIFQRSRYASLATSVLAKSTECLLQNEHLLT